MITGDEIHIWKLKTDQPHQIVAQLEKRLSPDERHRAAQFATSLLKSRFIVHRASLRLLLGQYLDALPELISFQYGAFGKPRISGAPGASALEFNLSHSDDLAVLAIALGRAVGIDIEHFQSSDDSRRLVERFFCPSERQIYLNAPEEERSVLFLQAWTRKEAYLKATGEGLTFPLDGVEVSLGVGAPPQLSRVEGRPGDPIKWSMIDVETGPGFVGALVAEGKGWLTRQSVFDPSAS